jgi:hypothetical protein
MDAIESWGTNGPFWLRFMSTIRSSIISSTTKELGILSYQDYNESKMRVVHMACVLALGVKNVVFFWEFINSYGEIRKFRVYPHNIRRLFEIVVEVPKKRVRGMCRRAASQDEFQCTKHL